MARARRQPAPVPEPIEEAPPKVRHLRPVPDEPESDIPSQPAHVWVRYDAPPGTHTPVLKAGLYWHSGTRFVVPLLDAIELPRAEGFVLLGPGPSPKKRP